MNDINPGVDLSILDKANEAQDAYITNPNMKTADAYIQALQETTMTLIDSILMLAGPEFRKFRSIPVVTNVIQISSVSIHSRIIKFFGT
jgi:hypothetical protein